MSNWTPPPGTKIVMPSVLITNAKFVPTRGSDVGLHPARVCPRPRRRRLLNHCAG